MHVYNGRGCPRSAPFAKKKDTAYVAWAQGSAVEVKYPQNTCNKNVHFFEEEQEMTLDVETVSLAFYDYWTVLLSIMRHFCVASIVMTCTVVCAERFELAKKI